MNDPGFLASALLPSITGNQRTDRLIRSGLLVITGGTTAWIIAWLKARGYSDQNTNILIAISVFSAFGTLATLAWGWLNGKNTEKAALQVLATGVQVGIAHAEDTENLTISASSISPRIAEGLAETYVPKTSNQ